MAYRAIQPTPLNISTNDEEAVGEEDSHDEGSEDQDEVTETEDPQSERGKRPVFHHNIYERLVRLMSRQGAYTNELPDYGIDYMDITSFHPDQRDWGFARPHRAPILTLWSETPGSAPTYPIGYLLFNGRLILDYAGQPIKAFRNLPLTISSAVRGFRVETWTRQEIHRLHMDDILARVRTRSLPNGREPLQKRADMLQRANLFRMKSGLIPFRQRNDVLRNAARTYLDSLRTVAQRASNQAIDRDLTAEETRRLKEHGRRGPMNAAAGPSANPGVGASATTSTPAVAITPSSPQMPHPHPSPPPQSEPATPLTPAPTRDLPDSRDDIPNTLQESYILTNALEETVEHFRKLTGQIPKPTDPATSYTSRWNALQAEFAPIWRSQRPAEKVPRLYKLGRWTGGIACWDDDWRTKVGGEERDRVDDAFLNRMNTTAEGSAYLGPDGTWRSVRDTWCNSHRDPAEDRGSQRGSGGENVAGETAGEEPEEGFEEFEGGSDDDFVGAHS